MRKRFGASIFDDELSCHYESNLGRDWADRAIEFISGICSEATKKCDSITLRP
jgi:hypothetical protein